MKGTRNIQHYSDKYTLSILQNKVHKAAMRRTVEHFKETRGYTITHRHIDKILRVMHMFIKTQAKRVAVNYNTW